jgi:TPP-dependent indolepyruvate ferredoxin oxidoreductase alpha subunit
VYLTGYQALVRLPMIQRERDRAAGLNTAGFVSGYRGSPLGGLDQPVEGREHLAEHDIVFQPGINEDLAATAVWGSQQVALSPKARVQGVFAMWYGKGPGSTAAATCSATPTPPAAAGLAACWRSPATTTRPSRPPCPTRPTTSSSR